VLGRYGGRDAKSAEARLSLPGLRYAMQAALTAHRTAPRIAAPAVPTARPLLAENYAAAKKMAKNECIHCHNINEFRRHDAKTAGTFRREDLWVYPLPENVGLNLDVNQGNKVKSVTAGSAADKAGIKAGDLVDRINGTAAASQADVMYGLHKAPGKGSIPISWRSNGKMLSGTLEVAHGWRQTNWTWRPSMLDILPALSLYGEDLSASEKKVLGLAEKRLAFRQDKTVHKDAAKMGVQGGDIIIGVDDLPLEMTMLEFLGYIRRNYLTGDTITLNVIRNGKRINLPGRL
jgi:S1-C subfamily serine protease